jgi:phytoene synthase
MNSPRHLPSRHPSAKSLADAKLTLQLDPHLGFPAHSQLAPADSVKVLAKYGKSFRFAGRFLSQEVLQDCARLYHFCRLLDDVVDESDDKSIALIALKQVRLDLKQQFSRQPVVQDFIRLAEHYSFDLASAEELINGLESDLSKVEIESEPELKRYCYRVAGVVGIFMCQIMGVRNKQALAHGVDLGIAMQMTNIARDVIEDAAAGRRYLPADWVEGCSALELQLPNHPKTSAMRHGVKHLLAQADLYYCSAWEGLRYLPLRNRIAIAVAAEVYRGIGVKLRQQDCDIWEGRVRIGTFLKSVLAMKALIKLLKISFQPRDSQPHQIDLHRALESLPHTNTSRMGAGK